jgi:ABC-type Na+ efflux pump permease subunit
MPQTPPPSVAGMSWAELLLGKSAVVAAVSVLLIAAGVVALRSIKEDSPLSPYVLQILGLTFILPVVLLVTLVIDVKADAIMGLLGTIVGYVFGTSRIVQQQTGRPPQRPGTGGGDG